MSLLIFYNLEESDLRSKLLWSFIMWKFAIFWKRRSKHL